MLTIMVSRARRPSYSRLCVAARDGGHVLKLSRMEGEQWGLQLLIRPGDGCAGWRGAAVLFPDLGELDQHAVYLLRWMQEIDTVGG